jgi:peptidoglycan/xylan/chitin deacetylase (PgdA/CDA1 family)
MSIGSHGWEHRDWRALDDDAAEQEIGLALRVLTEISGQPGVTPAYTSDGGWARVDAWRKHLT